MTLGVGDRVVIISLSGGGSIAVLSGEISVGDSVVLIPDRDGGRIAVKPTTPQVGDKVIVISLSGGGRACLVVAGDDTGSSSAPVLPPANFSALRDSSSTAALSWALNEGNDAVRIMRQPDRYPLAITDGVCVYEGAATAIEDSGLDLRFPYYYCAWGKAGSKYSNGHLTAIVPRYGVNTDPIFVTGAWHRAVSYPGEVVTYGPYRYQWDGLGQVYLSSSRDVVSAITIDDGPIISTVNGVINHVESTWSGICEITSILIPGENRITVQVCDNPEYKTNIGPLTPLYIMRAL